MTITFAKVNQIFKTLPIGYYLGRQLNAYLDDVNESYFNPMTQEIHVGYKMIERSVASLTDESKIESDVRTLLYHEVSHAMLTPSDMKMNDIINIFEDERIETVCRNLYHDVNFKEFCVRFNNYHGEDPISALEMFYQIVRYRQGPQSLVDEVANIISQHASLSLNAEYSTICRYCIDINNLWMKVQSLWCKQSSTSKQSNATNKQSNDNEQSTSSNNSVTTSILQTIERTHEKQSESIQVSVAMATINNGCNAYVNQQTLNDIETILSSIKIVSRQNGSAINSYSGQFNVRAVNREDCKFFVQQNRQGHVKQFSKFHLNLFIDCSGSFSRSQQIVNELLFALHRFEQRNPDFSFDLVTCGVGQTICDKQYRSLSCSGCNDLDEHIFEQFKSLQRTNCQVCNIVLFDGDAFSAFDNVKKHGKNFKAFDTSNTTIISDRMNEKVITENVHIAKTIFTDNYVDELYANVMRTLRMMSR